MSNLAHVSNLVPQSQHLDSLSTHTRTCQSSTPRKKAHLLFKGWVLFSHIRILFISITFKFKWESIFWKYKGWLAQTSPLWFDNFFRRVNHIWYKSTLHPFPTLLDCNLPSFNQLIYVSCQVCEGFLHINGISGWRLNVLHAVCSSQFLGLVASHLPLCIQVTLVTHQNKYNLVGLNVYFGLF